MLKEDYCEYSNLTIDEVESNILSLLENIDYNYIDLLKKDKNIIYYLLSLHSFNTDKISLLNKISLFSPQMLSLVTQSNYETFMEHMGDFGILSEIIKDTCPDMSVTYANIESDVLKFIKWKTEKYNKDIKILNLEDDCKISNSFDIIVSDGILQYFNEADQIKIVKNLIDNVNKNGIFCFLVDISGKSTSQLYNDVDISKIHSIIENTDMVCIYGRNTFSSLWKKII